MAREGLSLLCSCSRISLAPHPSRSLSQIIEEYGRENLIIQTKVPSKPTAEKWKECFDTSLQRLGLDYVDLCSFHGINHGTAVANFEICYPVSRVSEFLSLSPSLPPPRAYT